MERRGQRTTIQEQAAISELAAARQTDATTAAVLGCSIWTVRKWRRAAGRSRQVQQRRRPGRPSTGSLGTVSVPLRDHIRQLRECHPGWGAETILGELHTDPTWMATRLPSRSRIALFLKEAGLTRRYQRHSQLPQPLAVEAVCPHDTWQLDAQGVAAVAGVGRTCLINGIDVASRLKVESFPSVGTTNPPTEDYFLALRRALERKYEQTKTNSKMLISRAKAAEAQERVSKALEKVDIYDPSTSLGAMEDKIRLKEEKAKARAELTGSRFDARLVQLEVEEDDLELEAELIDLEARMRPKILSD
jgi:PspA/IM30 family